MSSSHQKGTDSYKVKYIVTYSGANQPEIGEFVHPNTHPREDQVLRQLLKLDPGLVQAEYVAFEVELNSANLGYKPYFGFDKNSIRAFLAQMNRRT